MRLRRAALTLGEYPNIGVAGVIPGTRRWVVDRYVVTTRQRDGAIEIIAIRHGRQPDGQAASGTDEAADGQQTFGRLHARG